MGSTFSEEAPRKFFGEVSERSAHDKGAGNTLSTPLADRL